jgi:hypothetical protein
MILALTFLVVTGLVMLAERSVEHLLFAVAAFCLSTAVLLLVVADFDRAILLAGLLAATIIAASTVKYNHSALKLIGPICRCCSPARFRFSSCSIRAPCWGP